jgi:B9 domain-containing protein 1
VDTGLSQTSRRLAHFEEGVVWNFPIDITFKSTNVFGWPRSADSVNGIDFLGRDVVLGYGSALIPLSVGHHIIDMDIYAPLAVSSFNQFMSWLMGNPPEVSMESLRGLL